MVMSPSFTGIIEEQCHTKNLNLIDQNPPSEAVDISNNQNQEESLSRELVSRALDARVQLVDHETCDAGEEDAFYVADLGEVYRQHLRWKRNLARVKPHYAVKCNPDVRVLALLASLGTGFDCASKSEIETVRDLGVAPDRIIYAHPCKTTSYIRTAAKEGVRQMTFDNSDELLKIKRHFPEAELLLRIATDDSASLCRLSQKFGAGLDTVGPLLQLARDLDLNIVGVAFHVGSGASDPNAYLRAVKDARLVFDQAAVVGLNLHTLDVGGGFIGETFEDMANVLSSALETYFPSNVRIVGEPGRFYVSGAFTIACNIIARRTVEDPQLGIKSYMLYLNDGVYGNFSSIMFDHQQPKPKILKTAEGPAASVSPVEYSIWGPTCDGIDCICSSITLDTVLNIGDWLFFENMGAYTKCSATAFNGFRKDHDTIYVCSETGIEALMDEVVAVSEGFWLARGNRERQRRQLRQSN